MSIEFYLNDELISLDHVRADATVLDFLREEKRLKGTKEGCAEGDCGACTVLIGRIENGALKYCSMNACIAFLPMLHRAHLVTIEALSPQGALHWVQDALSEFHGTQCGFCTPGIVMSLYVAWMNADASLSREDWQKALQGNLCRCTGYASILRAMEARQNEAERETDPLIAHRNTMKANLEALSHAMVANESEASFFIPQNITELEAVYAMNPNARLVAGATDVGLWVTKQFRSISPAIFLHQIDELNSITTNDDEIIIGAMVSYDDAEKQLHHTFPALRHFWPRIAGQQVRNMGTIGGNIANGSPIGDMPPVLIALNAKLRLNHGGTRREIAIEDFFIDYGKQDRAAGEFVEAVIVPRSNAFIKIYKISKRRDEDISTLLCAMAWNLDGEKIKNMRIAFGGMAATPKRAKSSEALLEGKNWSENIIREAANALEKDFQPISDMRASAEYRMKVAKNLLLRAYDESLFEAAQ